MDRAKYACFWAGAILAAAIASSYGLIDKAAADGLYFGLVLGAVASLGQVRCAGC